MGLADRTIFRRCASNPAIWAGLGGDAASGRDGRGPRLIDARDSRARKCPRFGVGDPDAREVGTKPGPIGRVGSHASRVTANPARSVGKSGGPFRPSRCRPQRVDRDRPDPAGPGCSARRDRRPHPRAAHPTPGGKGGIGGEGVGTGGNGRERTELAGSVGTAALIGHCFGPGPRPCRLPAPAQASAGTGAWRRSRTAAGTTPASEIMAVSHHPWRKASR